ncbi:MAG: DUF4091 domain-containing protein, partial [Oscillospiraceae bacterium]|nr:DUF4091 domain-containing protein [Oscillospiraceae bacterium]
KENPILNYIVGQALDLSTLVLKLTYSDGSIIDVSYNELDNYGIKISLDRGVTFIDLATALKLATSDDTKMISAYVNDLSCQIGQLSVKEASLIGIVTKTAPKLNYFTEESLDLNTLVLTLQYSDGSQVDVSYNEINNYGIKISLDGGVTFIDLATDLTLVTSDNTKMISANVGNLTCDVGKLSVKEASLTGIVIKTAPKLNYFTGEALDLSTLVLTLQYSDGSQVDVSYNEINNYGIKISLDGGVTFIDLATALTLTTPDDTKMISAHVNDLSCHVGQLSVNEASLTSIITKIVPKLNYFTGEALDLSTLVLTLQYSDGSQVDVNYNEINNYGIKISLDGGVTFIDLATDLTLASSDDAKLISAHVDDLSCDVGQLSMKKVTGIGTITLPQYSYLAGDKLNLSALVLFVTYSDGSTINVPYADLDKYGIKISLDGGITPIDLANPPILTVSNNGALISAYVDPSTPFDIVNITVKEPILMSIKKKTSPRLDYFVNENLDLSALVLTLKYNNGSEVDVGYDKFNEYRLKISLDGGKTFIDLAAMPILTISDNAKMISAYNRDWWNLSCDIDQLSVKEATVTDITVKTLPRLDYYSTNVLDLSALVLTLKYSDGTQVDVGYNDFINYGVKISLDGGSTFLDLAAMPTLTISDNEKMISAYAGDFSCEVSSLTVSERILESITLVTPPRLEYNSGDMLSLQNLVLKLTYSPDPTGREPDGIEVPLSNLNKYGIQLSFDNGTVINPLSNLILNDTYTGQLIKATIEQLSCDVGILTVDAIAALKNIGFTYSTDRIMKDSPLSTNTSFSLYLAQNEREGVQFSYKEDVANRNLKVVLSEFKDTSGNVLHSELFSMKYILSLTEAQGGLGADNVSGDGQYYPDALVPYIGENIPATLNENTPFYIEVRSTNTTPAGIYNANVQLFDADTGTLLAKGDISAQVWNFALPVKPAADVMAPLSWPSSWVGLGAANGVDPNNAVANFNLANGYFEFLLDHGISSGLLPVDILDSRADAYLNDPRLTTFYPPRYGFGTGQFDDPQMKQIIAKLQSNPVWADKAVYYFEGGFTKDEIYNLTAKLKELWPNGYHSMSNGTGWSIVNGVMDANTQLHYDNFDTLLSFPEYYFFPDFRNTVAQKWDRRWAWCTANGTPNNNPDGWRPNLRMDFQYLGKITGTIGRAIPWMMYAFNEDGYFYWMAAAWQAKQGATTFNPYVDGVAASADGTLIYPGYPVGRNPNVPIASIRLKNLTDGLEDMAYLQMAAEKGMTADVQAILIQAEVGYSFNQDPAFYENAHKTLGQMLSGQ